MSLYGSAKSKNTVTNIVSSCIIVIIIGIKYYIKHIV